MTKNSIYDKFGEMKKTKIIIVMLVLLALPLNALAFWMWTPETNKWVNPKYAVKDTPSEQLQYAMDFYSSEKYEEAIREFKKLISNYPKSKEAPEAQFYIGSCYEVLEQYFSAFKQYQMVIDMYPFSNRSADVVKKQYEIGVGILEGKKPRTGFLGGIAQDNYDVIEIFRAVIKNAPYGDLAAASQYKIALYLLEKKLYQESRDEFEKVVNDYPQSHWAKAAKYQIAVADSKRSTDAQYDQKVTQSAVSEFKEVLKNNPDAELSNKAKEEIKKLTDKEAENNFLIAQFYEKQKNYKAAKLYYQSIVDNYKTSLWASKALKKMSEISDKIK